MKKRKSLKEIQEVGREIKTLTDRLYVLHLQREKLNSELTKVEKEMMELTAKMSKLLDD